MTTNKISCILLAGGQSKRMGEDKAFLKLDGQTFLKIIVKKLYEKCDEITLSINKDEEIYQKELNEFLDKITFIKDKNPYDGPLNAVASVADSINNPYVFIATVDTPLLNPELIDFYKEKISDYDCILPVINGKCQPLNTLYKKDALEKAISLTEEAIEKLWDKNAGGFYLSVGKDVLIPQKTLYDGAIPSGNSVMGLNLVELFFITKEDTYENRYQIFYIL